ncbi:MAG: aminopeptidase N [Micrococcales bacterium]
MPGENLTRLEAQERASIIEVESYQIGLDLTTSEETFASNTVVRFKAKAGSSTFIDFISHSVTNVVLNGQSLDIAAVNDGVRIQLDHLKSENELVVEGFANYMHTGEGLHRFVDPVDNEVYLYSQFEVPDSRRVFAVFEQPDLKATFEFTVTAPSYWKVVSNSPTPEPEALEDGKSIWQFAPTKRLSSYVTAIVAGPYAEWRDELTSTSGDVIPLGVFCRASLAEFMDPEYIFEKTKQGFDFYENAFDVPYPFEKYDQLWVPEFNAGAMENAGVVTFTETYVFRSNVTDAIRERRVVTILHELAHMWFGDLVTMKWWNDLWLNESFAEYASTLATAVATEWHGAWTTFAALEKEWAYRQDQLVTTHPVVAEINDLEDVQVNFDGITYAKGASVLKALASWVGQDAFMAGVGEYFKKHAFGNTELKDLLVELEAKSGRDLHNWSKDWLETSGVNTLRPEIEVEADGTITKFAITQTAIAEHPMLRSGRLGIGFYNLHNGKVTRSRRYEFDVAGEHTVLDELVGEKRPDLILLNDDDLAYVKFRLDHDSWKFALANLSNISDSLARALVYGAAWDATRDAEVSARDYIRLVLAHIGNEDESTTIQTAMRNLMTAGNNYVAESRRQSVLAEIADGLYRLAREAKPGSDLQLQLVKFFLQVPRTEEQFNNLQGMLDGSNPMPGLLVDADMQWELLAGLVVAGRAGEAEIAEQLAKDNTSNGQKSAAKARAAIQSTEAKMATWETMVRTDEYSNALISFAAMGFGYAIDTSILKPFLSKYFDDVLYIWENKTFKMAEYILKGLYPFNAATQEFVDVAKSWLKNNDLSEKEALKRFILENLDITERILRCQAKDAASA